MCNQILTWNALKVLPDEMTAGMSSSNTNNFMPGELLLGRGVLYHGGDFFTESLDRFVGVGCAYLKTLPMTLLLGSRLCVAWSSCHQWQ